MSGASRAGSAPGHVMITGASSGLGAALARHYARSHSRLSLFGRDSSRLAEVVEACRALGADRAASYRCDVQDAEEMARCALAADSEAAVDVLIANAGVGGDRAIADNNGESLDRATALVNVNLIGVLNTVAPLTFPMVARGRGRIALIGSLAGMLRLPISPTYCATKAAVHVYAEALRRALRPKGVSVTLACPGFVETPMSASLPTPRPFLSTAESAAERIARAIERRRALEVFPWQLHAAIIAARVAPSAIVDRILSAAPVGTAP